MERAGILRITQDGNPVLNGNFTQLGNMDPLDEVLRIRYSQQFRDGF